MSRARSRATVLLLPLIVGGCRDAPTTPEPVATDHTHQGLELLFPGLEREMLVAEGSAEVGKPREGGPSRALTEGEQGPLPEIDEDDASSLFAAIYDPRTIAGVGNGRAWARGEHSYQGNKGRVETTVHLTFEGEQVGSQRAVTENARSFILDFGLVKYISAFARIYTNRDCGLAAWGGSEHSAWWEAVIGGSASVHGRAARTTQSSLARTADCPPPVTGTYGGLIEESGGLFCWVSIWYDMYTGEVYYIDVLYCT